MPEQQDKQLDKKLDKIIYLLQHLLALELTKTNLNWSGIGKHIVAEKKKVNAMLKGIGKGQRNV
jgi:hypothetical protein